MMLYYEEVFEHIFSFCTKYYISESYLLYSQIKISLLLNTCRISLQTRLCVGILYTLLITKKIIDDQLLYLLLYDCNLA